MINEQWIWLELNIPGLFICISLLEDMRKLLDGCRLIDLVLSKLDGNSDILSDSCLLNGEAWLSCVNPRNEPCRCNIDNVAWGLSIALVLTFGVVGFCCNVFTVVGISRINIKCIYYKNNLIQIYTYLYYS